MPDVKIGTDDHRLLLSRLDAMTGPPESILADLRLDGLVASVTVARNYASGFEDLADFFEQQARDWRGWEGTREWASLEGDLKIATCHQYGHVQLRVSVQRALAGWGNDGWTATGDLTIEPGEQLTRIAEDLRGLVDGAA